MILCLPTHVINLLINDNSLEIIYIYIYMFVVFFCFFFFFFFFFFFLANPVLKLVPSTSTPEVYDDVQLQCIVTKAEMLNGNVTFKFGNDTIVVMEQNDTACSASFVKNADLYRPQCSPKTYFRESRTKTYELSLPSFPPAAFGLWRCEFVPDCEGYEVRSNTVELKQTSKFSYIS